MAQQRTQLPSLSVFFPAYNEAKNIPPLIQQTLTILPQIAHQFEIIIVNDGSTDQTAKVAEKLAQQHQPVRVVQHPKNLGYGAALRTGFASAQYEWTFFSDSDGQFDLQQLRDFVPHTREFDVVIGYRQNRAEGQFRTFNAWLFKQYVNLLFRVGVKDIDCAFKLFKTELVQNVPLKSKGAMISAETLYRLKKKGVHFKQIPVKHLPRKHGNPTGNNPKVVIKAGYEALKLYLEIKFGKKLE